MNWDINYGDLANNTRFVNICEDLKANLIEVNKAVEKMQTLREHYDKMPIEAQIELDLCSAYTLNGLYWIRLRVEGIDPKTHPVDEELLRIKNLMKRWHEFKNLKNRPTVNIDVAKRFVRSGLYDPSNSTVMQQNRRSISEVNSNEPEILLNKKIKFSDEDK